MSAKSKFFTTGKAAEVALQNATPQGTYLRLEDGDRVFIVPLLNWDDCPQLAIHEYWPDKGWGNSKPVSHICIAAGSESCPGEELENVPRLKRAMPVISMDSVDGEPRLQILEITPKYMGDFQEADEVLGGVAGQILSYKRTGSGRNDTSYKPTAIGKPYANLDQWEADTEEMVFTGPNGEKLDLMRSYGPFTREEIVKVLVEAGVMSESSEWDNV